MATDPKILKQLEDDLESINNLVNDISASIGKNMNASLAVTSEEAKNLANEFEKGNDITKKLEASLKKAQRENRKLGLDQNTLNAQLIEAQEELNREYNETNKKKVQSIRSSIQDNKYQQQLNESVIEYLRKLDQINETERKNTEEKRKQNSLTENLKNKYNDLAKNFTLPALWKFILDAGLKADRQTVELGKSFGISYKAASGIRNEFVAYSRAAQDSFVNTDRLLKAQSELTEQLGFAVKFSAQEAETFARLTEIVGLTAQEAGNLAKFSAATGISTKDYVKNIRSSAFYAQQTTKTHFSDRQILQDVSKLSAGILTKFQGNPKAIAEAVVQAKALGTSLEQVDKVGESLLNFESSIQSELEAELLTGKQINLEKARYAALTGDQVTLMQEVAAQAGSLAEFQNMNTIAAKSLAAAFGMSRDEMAEMLMKQEAINKYGSEAAKLNAQQLEDLNKSGLSLDDYLKKQDEQRNIQERFNDAMTKLQDIIGNLIAGPLGRFLQMITSILDNTVLLSGILGGVMVANLIKMANAAKVAKSASMGEAIANIFNAAYKSVGGLPGIGLILAGAGAAAGIAALTTASSKVEDGIAPPGRGPFTIMDSFGATAITAAGDGIAVSPNIQRNNNSNNDGLIAAIERIANRPAIAYINGKDAFAKDLGGASALGTSQTQGSYQLA
jgi:hypothetical protein